MSLNHFYTKMILREVRKNGQKKNAKLNDENNN